MSAASDTAQALQRIAVSGAGGRMGQMLIEAVLASDDCALSGALDLAASPLLGVDAAAFAAFSVFAFLALKCGSRFRPRFQSR